MVYVATIGRQKGPIMTRNEILLAKFGRKLIDISENMNMKGLSDEQIARVNRMNSFGDALTRVGVTFGPRTLQEILDVGGVTLEEAQQFMALAK
jgi:hypothetical protein